MRLRIRGIDPQTSRAAEPVILDAAGANEAAARAVELGMLVQSVEDAETGTKLLEVSAPAAGLTEQELGSFVGPRADYYLRKWRAAIHGDATSTGFNWAAFFLAGLWLPYRKMYAATAILYGIILVEETVSVGILHAASGRFLGLAIAVLCGLCGNGWYLRRARSVVAELRGQNLPEDVYLQALSRRGGTSIAAVLVALAAFLVLSVGSELVQQHLKGVPDSRGEFEEFAKVEEQVLATFNKAIRQRQRGAIDDAQLLELIDRDVLPPWRSERERLARINGGPAARQWSVGRLTRYMETREQGWLLLCRALRENDSGLVEQANTKLQEADKLAESIAADAGGRRR